MNPRTLLLAATALTFAPLARGDEAANVNELTAKVLAILNSPAGQEELSKQLQALAAALKANGQGDLDDAVAKLAQQLEAGKGKADGAAVTATPTVTPEGAADGAAAAPAAAPEQKPVHGKSAPAAGLQTSHLQGGSLQSAGQGLTGAEEWQRMFSR